MAEQRESPAIPPVSEWFKVTKNLDGSISVLPGNGFYRLIAGERGRVTNVNSGQSALIDALADTQAEAAAQAAATQAAVAAGSGATSSDQDDFINQTVSSGTYATYATCNITTTGAGNYTITASLGIIVASSTALVSNAGTFSGNWRIIENPNTHVLASGTFTITTTLEGGEGGSSFYTHTISFGTVLPTAATYADNETGATTIELQLARASGTNSVSGLFGSVLTTWA